MHPYSFGAMGSNLTKLFQVTCHEADMIKWVHFFGGGTAPLGIWEGKNRPKFGAILRNFTLRSRISPEWMKVWTSGKWCYHQHSLPRWIKKLGEIWSTNKKVIGMGIDPPKISTACAVHRLTQLRSCHACHVTLLRPELQPPNCPQSDLGRQAATRWALPSISSLLKIANYPYPSVIYHPLSELTMKISLSRS